jgi:uracil-DNA glycosylase
VELGEVVLIGSYHVSQQNTFTGKLTPRMFDDVLERCKSIGSNPHPSPVPA